LSGFFIHLFALTHRFTSSLSVFPRSQILFDSFNSFALSMSEELREYDKTKHRR